MSSTTSRDIEDLIDQIDMSAIAIPDDKINECEYYLKLASNEKDNDKFRWLISAFFNAAYSFFEITALSAYNAYNDPENGDPIEDGEALDAIRCYVRVFQNSKNPSFVKTSGLHEITEKLYDLRKENTHHYPLSIMKVGESVPEDFHFGYLKGEGTPALEFCREVMGIIFELNKEI